MLDVYPDDGYRRASELKEEYEETREHVLRCRREFAVGLSTEEVKDRCENLLAHGSEIHRFKMELAGWRERVQNLGQNLEANAEKRNELQLRAGQINDQWSQLSQVLGVKTDLLDEDRLQQVVSQFSRRTEELEAKEEERRQCRDMIEDCQDELEEVEPVWLIPWATVLVVWILGVVLGALALPGARGWQVWLVTVILLGLGTAFFGSRTYRALQASRRASDLQASMAQQERRLRQLDARVEQLREEIREMEEEMGRTCRSLGLPEDLSPSAVESFYRRTRELKNRIGEWKRQVRVNQDLRQRIEEQLQKPAEVLEGITGFKWEPAGEDIGNADKLFSEIDRCHEQLAKAEELAKAEQAREQVCERILDLVAEDPGVEVDPEVAPEKLYDELLKCLERGKAYEELAERERRCNEILNMMGAAMSERLRTALEDLVPEAAAVLEQEGSVEGLRQMSETEKGALGRFLRVGRQYSSVEEVREEVRRLANECERLEERLEEESERRRTLEIEKEELSTDERLLRAQEKINRGREGLEPLAEKYARLRIATVLLDRLLDDLREETSGILLAEASDIFQTITGDTYERITPAEDLSRAEYEAVTKDGSGTFPTSQLSGATREQLFLSVRMARLREIEPKLPLILDDSAANFDPAHRWRTVDVLTRLAKDHQVFVLTCHPELIKMIREKAEGAQYWTLVQGHFQGPFGEAHPAVDVLQEEV